MPKILLAPLDWGLGHTTRSMQIAHELLNRGVEVVWGASKQTQPLIREVFPHCRILDYPSYGITYSKNANNFILKLLAQVPTVKRIIEKEYSLTETLMRTEKFSAIISDNRFGVRANNTPSVIVSHQLELHTGKMLADKIATRQNLRYINSFDACWVPDIAEGQGLAGKLSHPSKKPSIPVEYIGFLSRFSFQQAVLSNPCDLLVMISGPEPQRKIFEEKILEELHLLNMNAVVVLGVPNSNKRYPGNVFPHLPSEELSRYINGAHTIIARAGYSSIMDLMVHGRTAYLVPTPGQGEQEYLCGHVSGEGLFKYSPQPSFSIHKAVEEMKGFHPNLPPVENKLGPVMDAFIANL